MHLRLLQKPDETAKEVAKQAGVTAEVASRISSGCFDDLDAPVGRVGMAEVPMPYAKSLEDAALTRRFASFGGMLAALVGLLLAAPVIVGLLVRM